MSGTARQQDLLLDTLGDGSLERLLFETGQLAHEIVIDDISDDGDTAQELGYLRVEALEAGQHHLLQGRWELEIGQALQVPPFSAACDLAGIERRFHHLFDDQRHALRPKMERFYRRERQVVRSEDGGQHLRRFDR